LSQQIEMKFLLSSFILSSALATSSALIDCSVVERAEDELEVGGAAACNHFLGIDHQSYINWYDSSNIDAYPNSFFLQGSDPQKPEDGAAIHWRVDDEYLHLDIAARATGWLSFGISEAGGMTGTDMVIFTANRPDELVDAYIGDERAIRTACGAALKDDDDDDDEGDEEIEKAVGITTDQ
jgi:hypothetical protein